MYFCDKIYCLKKKLIHSGVYTSILYIYMFVCLCVLYRRLYEDYTANTANKEILRVLLYNLREVALSLRDSARLVCSGCGSEFSIIVESTSVPLVETEYI